MARAKPSTDPANDLIVVWWDGFGREHQSVDKKPVPEGAAEYEIPLQWEFSELEAAALCKKEIKRGAIRAEVWRPGSPPEKIAAFVRTDAGNSQQTYPSRR